MTKRAHSLFVLRCPHGSLAVEIGVEGIGGRRVTPMKCCGRWNTLASWQLSPDDWREIAELAEVAAEECDQAAEKLAKLEGRE